MPEIALSEHHSWFVFLRSVVRNSTRKPAVLTCVCVCVCVCVGGWREIRDFIQSLQENVATVQKTHVHYSL